MCGQFDENDREFFALCEECEEREYFDNNGPQDMVTSCIILHNMMVQQQLEGGEECMGDYFEEGLPQHHDNDDSDIADEAEDDDNMLEVELSHGNLCNPQLQFQPD